MTPAAQPPTENLVDNDSNAFTSHPPGLAILFFTEMWERFSYYGMRALLVLYMVKHLHFSQPKSSQIYGWYTGLVYLTPVAGGLIADRLLGYKTTIILGGLIMMVGHFLMAVDNLPAFFCALALLILGNGAFKANISTVVGKLYRSGDPRRDRGFSIFYVGINLGAFLSPLVCGGLGERYGYHWGFAAAGVGMLIGLITFVSGQRWLRGVEMGRPPKTPRVDSPAAATVEAAPTSTGKVIPPRPMVDDSGAGVLRFLPGGLLLLGGLVATFVLKTGYVWYGAIAVGASLLIREGARGAVASPAAVEPAPAVDPAGSLPPNENPATERGRILALFIVAFFVVFFWAAYEQSGNTLTLWADDNTVRDVTLPLVGSWTIPTTWFQSVNPMFIFILAPLLSLLWGFLSHRNKEPSTALKMVLGLFFLGVSFVVMVVAATAAHGDHGRVSSWWLIGSYFFATVGEVCLSPIGLSLVTKLAPARLGGMLMGVWFMATFVGNWIAGMIGVLWQRVNHVQFFAIFVVSSLLAAGLMFALLKPLKRLMAGAA